MTDSDPTHPKYCDLLTALFWVTCRNPRQVTALRINALDSEFEWTRHPAPLADFFAHPDHLPGIDIIEPHPSRALIAALERDAVRSLGLFPGELEPRAIAGSVWTAGTICGGEVGRRVIGGCACAGQTILGVMIDWSDLMTAFPAAASLPRANLTPGARMKCAQWLAQDAIGEKIQQWRDDGLSEARLWQALEDLSGAKWNQATIRRTAKETAIVPRQKRGHGVANPTPG